MIETEGIDHVAMSVQDLKRSVEWYQRILGLERRFEQWDPPVMLGAGTTAVALFPARAGGQPAVADPATGFRHLAFRVSRSGFEKAQDELTGAGIAFDFQDHGAAHSIYFDDPDGHHLEITTYELDA